MSRQACAALLPHARAALDPSSDGMARIARYLGQSGSYQAARDLCRQIAGARTANDAYGPEHPGTLAARPYTTPAASGPLDRNAGSPGPRP